MRPPPEWEVPWPADYVLFIDKKPVGIIEAKRAEEGHHLSVVEEQSEDYAHAKLKHLNNEPLRFIYESTGELMRFCDVVDPKLRSWPVFSFHCPEILRVWSKQEKSLRARLLDLPQLNPDKLRDCQVTAITNLDKSLKNARPKALVQMATGSGKTFTAITAIYRPAGWEPAWLTAAQILESQPHTVSGRYQKSGRTGRAGVSILHT